VVHRTGHGRDLRIVGGLIATFHQVYREIREFREGTTSSVNALREDLAELCTRVETGFAEMRGNFDKLAVGQRQIVDLMTTLIESASASSGSPSLSNSQCWSDSMSLTAPTPTLQPMPSRNGCSPARSRASTSAGRPCSTPYAALESQFAPPAIPRGNSLSEKRRPKSSLRLSASAPQRQPVTLNALAQLNSLHPPQGIDGRISPEYIELMTTWLTVAEWLNQPEFPALPSGHTRIMMLTPAGARFGQGPDSALRADKEAATFLAARRLSSQS
jgi:hypothetical protein